MSACGVCGGAGREVLPGILECGSCGLAYREEKYFGAPQYSEGLATGIYGSAKARLFVQALDLLDQEFPGRGRLLDIGCASGELMRAAADRGWQAEGLEIDPSLAARASGSGFAVHVKPVEECGLERGTYSAISVFEVFSQMAHPAAAAEGISKVLKPGGMIYIREFNAAFHLPLSRLEAAGLFRPFGMRPAVLHNFNFRARTLRALLERAGFTEIKIRNSRPTSGDPYRTGGALGGFLTRGLKFLYYTLAQALWYASLGRVYAGSSLIVTARKP